MRRIVLFMSLVVSLAMTALAADPAAASSANPLPNPGFESGGSDWVISDRMSTIVPEAAHSGQLGMRVADERKDAGSSVTSRAFPVTPGQEVTLKFWGRTDKGFLGVYLWFKTASGQLIKEDKFKVIGGVPMVAVKGTEWTQHTLTATAPENAASVSIWIHSWGSATGVADLDDFELTGLAEGVEPLPMAAKTPAKAAAPVELPPRKQPPIIVLKFDDLKPVDGKVHGLWLKLVDYLESRDIKGSMGIVCKSLNDASPEFCQWVKDRKASGKWEFWFHGWDHGTHDVDGKKYNEFSKRSYEEQKKRFDDSQALAKEKFGFAFETFGPPGGASTPSMDAETYRVMQDDPNMKVWLYPTPIDNPGKKLATQNKVVILDRVWSVNTEKTVGKPDFDAFVAGYAKNPDRQYFFLQGHPMHWSPDRFKEFTRIIDFLVEQKAQFMTPTECAQAVGNLH